MTRRLVSRHVALRKLVADERHPQSWRDGWSAELQTLDAEQARAAGERWNRLVDQTREHARRRAQEKAR